MEELNSPVNLGNSWQDIEDSMLGVKCESDAERDEARTEGLIMMWRSFSFS